MKKKQWNVCPFAVTTNCNLSFNLQYEKMSTNLLKQRNQITKEDFACDATGKHQFTTLGFKRNLRSLGVLYIPSSLRMMCAKLIRAKPKIPGRHFSVM